MVRISDIPNYSKNLPFIESILSGIAKYFTWALVHTPMTGANVTFLSIILGIIGSAFAIQGSLLLGFAFFCGFILLDHVDGQVARFKNQSGKAGVYLDSRAHFIVEPLFLLSLGIGSSIKYGEAVFAVAGIISSLAYLMRQTMKTGDLGSSQIRSLSSEKSLFGKINYLAFDFIRINNPFGLIIFAIIFEFIGWAVVAYAILLSMNMIICFISTYFRLKDDARFNR